VNFVTISGTSTAIIEYDSRVTSPTGKSSYATKNSRHLLFIVTRAEYCRHDVQLMVVMLSGLGQFCCDVEFLILIESQACCARGIQHFREKILHDKHIVRLHSRDAVRDLPLYLQLESTAFAVFRDKHVVSHLDVWRTHVRLFVVRLNSSFAITRSLLCHLCINLRHSL
jgi:hypothetical protein